MSARSAIRKLASIEPIWGFIAFVAALAGDRCSSVLVRHYEPIQTPEIAWCGARARRAVLASACPVELEFRRSSHSFSLTDMPLSIALIFTTGSHAFVADPRRHGDRARSCAACRSIKFCFNLAQLALVLTA